MGEDDVAIIRGDLYRFRGGEWSRMEVESGGTPVPGEPGIEGSPGPRGPQGIPGPVGPQGLPGPSGPEGQAGPTGPQGAQGAPGPKGDNGTSFVLQGTLSSADELPDPSVAGHSYFVGADLWVYGEQGWINAGPVAQGPKGDPGDQGPVGPAGPVGPEGPRGADGPQGVPGPQGDEGPEGPRGPVGERGPAGPAGPAGADRLVGGNVELLNIGPAARSAFLGGSPYPPGAVIPHDGKFWLSIAENNATPSQSLAHYQSIIQPLQSGDLLDPARPTYGASPTWPDNLELMRGLRGTDHELLTPLLSFPIPTLSGRVVTSMYLRLTFTGVESGLSEATRGDASNWPILVAATPVENISTPSYWNAASPAFRFSADEVDYYRFASASKRMRSKVPVGGVNLEKAKGATPEAPVSLVLRIQISSHELVENVGGVLRLILGINQMGGDVVARRGCRIITTRTSSASKTEVVSPAQPDNVYFMTPGDSRWVSSLEPQLMYRFGPAWIPLGEQIP